ncbi:MAG: hypothetical protein ACOYMN_14865 [Roseimicrobium sp.]
MKTPADPNDPLLRSLAEEAADLPLKAAGEARRTRALRMKHHRQAALALSVLFCGVCAWQIYAPRDRGRELIATHTSPDSRMNVAKHVIVRTEEQARYEPLPLPDGLSADQAKVVLAAQGLPLLLIRDHTGRVARIHTIER